MTALARLGAVILVLSAGCESTLPSAKLENKIRLPVPAVTHEPNGEAQQIEAGDEGEVQIRPDTYVLTARRLITLTFDLHPDIKSSYKRFKSEEARYDFFVVSRDSLTPTMGVSSSFSEDRADEMVTRESNHVAELGVEKRFFDTTELNMGVGFRSDTEERATGDHPFAAANLRYPLWVSRERLARASEEIFRRNEVNDAQLAYIQQVRRRASDALFSYYDLTRQGRTVQHFRGWLADLQELAGRMKGIKDRDISVDMQRVEAEITRIAAEVGVAEGWYEVRTAHLKLACGIPFEAAIELKEVPFNPFEGATQERLLEASIDTDPEIATLRNAMENAYAQYDLAKRGKWDVTLNVTAESDLEGAGEDEGVSDWAALIGVEVSAVDPRVTESLIRQSEANINRFKYAIDARENSIFVNTLEPLIRLDTVGASRDELISNLPLYEEDYRQGVEDYLAGRLNIDDLIKRREDLFSRQQNISQQTWLLGANVTQLCAATGKFFELLDEHINNNRKNGSGS
jgi:outer membrane protein TolC